MLRFLDFVLAVVGIILSLPILLAIFLLGLVDTGSPLFFQLRLGQNQKLFKLVKFRTMRPNTVSVATHLANPLAVTKLGSFLRQSKLDELPQLWNVLRGEMSLVGPRPCLPNQIELISERAVRRIFDVRPGITGLAQIQGIDMSTPQLLAETEARMLKDMNSTTYFRYIRQTLIGAGRGDRIKSP